MEITEKFAATTPRESRCLPADASVPAFSSPANWSFHRATEADRPEIATFQSQGVVLAGDRDIALEVCKGDPGATNKRMEGRTWIAREAGKIVGLLWIAVSGSQLANIAGICVDPRLRGSRLPVDLLSYALRFCRDAGILKVVLTTHLPEQEAWAMFGKCGYDAARQRQRDGRHVMEFYLNLYRRPDCESSPTEVRRRRNEGQCNEIQP